MRVGALMVIISFIAILHPRSIQEIFLEGNQLYYDAKYHEALDRYKAIDQVGPAVWYNMGNSYYRIGDTVRARAAWRRAQKQAPAHIIERAQRNITAVEKELGLPASTSFSAFMRHGFSHISFFILQILLLLGWYLFFLLLFVRIPYRMALLWFLMGCNSLIIAGIGIKYWSDMQQHGLVLEQSLMLRVGPGYDFHALSEIQQGDELIIKNKESDWYKVKYQGRLGWISKDAIEVI